MPIYPRPDQIEALMKSDIQGPIDMLNLLVFKEHAEYEDGRETELSGREAYALYAAQMQPHVEANGGTMLYGGAAHLLMIGDGDVEWDMVATVRYPSREAFVKIATSKDVAAFAVHRTAGLAHQLLVACTSAPPD
jgi:uncharacterized protein (DUF1330 family)